MQSPDTSQRWVPFDEACRILGRTPTTLRREIKAGRVVAEVLPRNPDNPADSRTVYRVRVDLPPEDAPTPTTAPESPSATEAATEPPAATTGLLEILETLLVANGETMERQAEAIAELRERVGGAEARAERRQAVRDRARNALAEYAERLRLAERPWWQRWLRPD
jgi:hypothetical protein